MKNIKKLLCAFFVIIPVLSSFTVYAEKTYNAGILADYEFLGNNISDYARSSIKDVFTEADNTALNIVKDFNLSEGLGALNSGAVNFLCMVPKSDALASVLDYTSKPMATGFLTLFTSTESDIYFEDFANFTGMKIGMLKDSYFLPDLSRYAAKNNFTFTPIYFNDIDALYEAAKSQSVSAILTPATSAPDGLRIAAKCGQFDYYCAVKKGDAQMLSFLNSVLTDYEAVAPFFMSDLYQNYFNIPYANMLPLTPEANRASKTQQKLRVFVSNNHYPLAYLDQETSEYTGIYVEELKKIAQNCNLELVYVPGEQEDITMNSIIIGRADIILTVSGSTQGLIEASKPYTSLDFVPIVKESVETLSDGAEHKIGVLKDDVWIENYLADEYPSWTVKQYRSVNSLIRAAEFGSVDGALISSIDMHTKTSLSTHPRLKALGDETMTIPVSLGISKVTCPQDVVNLINDSISYTPLKGAEDGIEMYAMSNSYVYNVRDMLYRHKWLLIAALLALIAIIAVFKLRERYFKMLAQSDSLTNIHNSQYFYKTAEKMLAKNPDKPFLLASVDARNFKLINDRFGHIIGDQTLVSISNEIAKIFKDNGLYARLQSDNFIILVEDTAENRVLLDSLEHIDIHIHDSSEYRVPIKTGVCPIPSYDPKIPLSSYIDKANIAKDETPGRSTNYLRYFTDEMAAQLDTKNNIEVEMVHALHRGEFVVFYQPKYELSSDKIIGAEALVRWNHREKGLISPGLFVPLFEQNGFIINLDFYVYESVFKTLKERLRRGLPVVPVSMNVSRCHLGDKKFAEKLDSLVSKYQIPKEYIEMEITESIFSEADSSAIELIYDLKKRGFSISMDDFGSGYSSLNLLRKVPIDTLKIDKVFIDNAETDVRGRVIVEAIITMASKIQLKTICEGVETKAQRDFLKDAGCDMVQGFFYSRPLPCSDFESLLDSSK